MEATIGQIDIKITGNADNAKKSVDNLSKSMSSLSSVMKAFSVGAFVKGLESIGQTIFKLGSKQSAYIETMNLFRQTMGESTEEATAFVNKAEQLLGLDSANLMKSISYLQELAEGFGLSNQEAFIMSKNLTQLAADMQSYLNIPFEQALKKVKSGLAGEIEPMRAVGVALDKASLQETARQLGIERSIDTMTRAQKTELLYYQMITKTATMQGDLARTMLSPANATKLMQTAFVRLARAIGSIFIPIMMKIIPVVIAVTEILEAAAKSIAAFFGFKLSDYQADISKIGTSLGGVSAGLDDVGGSAKKAGKELQKMLMPFDELNNVNFETGSSGGGGIGSVGGGGGLGIDLPEYDMFEGYTSNMRDNIEKIKRKIKEWLPLLKVAAGLLAGMFVGAKIVSFITSLGNFLKALQTISGVLSKFGLSLGGVLKVAASLALIIGGLITYFVNFNKIGKAGENTAKSLALSFAGAAAAAVGLGLLIGGLPGLIIGVVAAMGLIIAASIKADVTNKAAVKSTKEAAKELATAQENLVSASKSYEDAIDRQEDALKSLQEIEKETGLSGKELYDQVQNGTLTYENMTIQQRQVYKAYKESKEAQEELKKSEEEYVKAKQKEKYAHWENELAVAKESGSYEEFKKKLIEAYKAGEISAQECRTGMERAMADMSDSAEETFMQDIPDDIKQGLDPDRYASNWSKFKEDLLGLFKSIKNGISDWWQNSVKPWFNQNVKPWFTYQKWYDLAYQIVTGVMTQFNILKTNLHNKIEEIKTNIINKFNDIKDGIFRKFEDIKNGIRDKLNAIKNFFNFSWSLPHIKTPHLYWTSTPASGWIYNILSALNLPTSLPKLNISWYAEGGFPETGQLFIANEAGPELVGNIGNKTAVANQSQITEGIAEATYNAMSRALQENNGSNGELNPQFDIYIGNEKVYSGFGKHRSQQSNKYGVTM